MRTSVPSAPRPVITCIGDVPDPVAESPTGAAQARLSRGRRLHRRALQVSPSHMRTSPKCNRSVTSLRPPLEGQARLDPWTSASRPCSRHSHRDRPIPVTGRSSSEIDDLGVRYGAVEAVSDVTMEIYRNQVTAIIGPSGCGKSTFIRCLNRMNDLVPWSRGDRQAPLPRHRPARPEGRSGRSAAADRHGVPAAEPVPEVDLRQRRVRAAHARA